MVSLCLHSTVTFDTMNKALKVNFWTHLAFIGPISVLQILFAPPLPLPPSAPSLLTILQDMFVLLVSSGLLSSNRGSLFLISYTFGGIGAFTNGATDTKQCIPSTTNIIAPLLWSHNTYTLVPHRMLLRY
jgi:hypothetical protein